MRSGDGAAVYLDCRSGYKTVSVKLTESERLSCTVYNTPQSKKKRLKNPFFKN